VVSPGSTVVVANSGAVLGIPLVAFTFGAYWDSYCRGRAWYRHRPHYYNYWNRYPDGRPPPPPHRPIVKPQPPPPQLGGH
jgi:uncharacterized protein YraI